MEPHGCNRNGTEKVVGATAVDGLQSSEVRSGTDSKITWHDPDEPFSLNNNVDKTSRIKKSLLPSVIVTTRSCNAGVRREQKE